MGVADCLPATTRFAGTRCSIARCTPARWRPGASGMSRPTSAPAASRIASWRARSTATGTSTPTAQLVTNSTRSARNCAKRRSMCRFSSLKSGMPYRISPPSSSSRSYTVTACPARASCCAAASPAGPEPTTATDRPEDSGAGCGVTYPRSKARLMISTSTCLMVTADPPLMASTQAASHGAGQSRPVNSGKLFVACNCSMAYCHCPVRTRSFQSGIRLPSGQPWWQNGTPQSMQRVACSRISSSDADGYTSRQSWMRTGTGRRVGSLRSYLRKPCGSGTRCLHHGLVDVATGGFGGPDGFDHTLVLAGYHRGELLGRGHPLGQQAGGDRRAGLLLVPLDQVAQRPLVVGGDRFQVDQLPVDPAGVQPPDERHAAGHPRGEVAAGGAEHDDGTPGHVLAGVVAYALDDCDSARVADREALADPAAQEQLAAGGPVQDRVAGYDLVLGRERRRLVGPDHQPAAGQPLAHVVVRVAGQPQRDAVGHEGTEGLAGGAAQVHLDGVVGQPLAAELAGHLAAQHRADAAVLVAHGDLDAGRGAVGQRRRGRRDEPVVQCAVQSVVLRGDAVQRRVVGQVRHVQYRRQIQPLRLPVLDRRYQVQQLGMPDGLVEAPEAERGEQLPDLPGEEPEEVLHELRLAGVPLAQYRVLRGDADRAGVEVADAHHDAALDDQRRGREPVLLGAQQRRDQHVPAGLELAVDLHG